MAADPDDPGPSAINSETGGLIERGGHSGASRAILIGSGQLLSGRVARTAMSVIGMVILARLLTPADFGVLAWGTAVTVLSLVLLEGLIDYPAIRDDALTTDSLRGLIWAGICITGGLSIVLWFAAPMAERLVAFPRLAFTLRAMIPVCLSQVFLVAGLSILRRKHRFGAAAMISVFTIAAYMLLAVLLVVAGKGMPGVIIALVVANLATAVILQRMADLPVLPPRDFRAIRTNIHVGGMGALSRLLAWGWTNIDTLAISLALGPAATGLYSRAYNITVQAKEPFLAVDQTMRQVFATKKSNGADIRAQLLTSLRMVTLVSALLAACLVMLRDEVIFLLLGPKWEHAAIPLAILALGLPARVARLFFDGLSVLVGDMRGLALRNALILLMMAGALAATAHFGIGYVAASATMPLYIALLFSVGAQERLVIGGLRDMLLAMLPGLLIAAALVALDDVVLRPSLATSMPVHILAVAALTSVTGALLAIYAPPHWIGVTGQRIRTMLLRRVTSALG